MLFVWAQSAHAFTVNITAANPKAIYLQVGVGTFTGGNYNAGGTPGNNTTINTVSVTVPAAAVGNGTAQDHDNEQRFGHQFLRRVPVLQLAQSAVYRRVL